jgi:hypothetical protein
MLVAVFSRMQESDIIVFPHVAIVPSPLPRGCVFLRMLQLLILNFAPDVQREMQVCAIATLSANVVYENEPVTVESLEGQQYNPDRLLHLFMDILTDG